MTTPLLGNRARLAWRMAQILVWLVGVTIVGLLLWSPEAGIHAFWNVLIPVAPALLAFAPGLWRNICPMATTALATRHFRASLRRRVPTAWQGRLLLLGVALLFAIVPLRHVVLDTSGPATALALLLLALTAAAMGSIFEWKSGWCSGMCPVHPVERLYGSAPALTPPNAHCDPCERCVQACPDATTALDPLSNHNGTPRFLAGVAMVGAFPGFIWGWFHVQDYPAGEGWRHLGIAYGYPFAAAAATLLLFWMLRARLDPARRVWLRRAFAAAAIACYYWYRLPALFGFGPFPGDGMLIDLRGVLPSYFPAVSRVLTTALFVAWFPGRRSVRGTWLVRPPFAASSPPATSP